ncbi:MAG: hypothetical protein HQL15_00055 [Candidatus Omnitrophica bacterium]|nr:hypothetical protein [Candidatus Omnitrophota bacterium]
MILYGEILKEFQKQEVKYIIVGGMAINLHGYLRSTADMEVLVEMSEVNLKKIVTILRKKGYRVKQPVDPMGIADMKTRRDWIRNKNMKAFNFYKEKEMKEVDIIIESPVTYEAAQKNVLHLKIDNLTVFVISIGDLIKMKSKAGREIDLADVKQLKKIRLL